MNEKKLLKTLAEHNKEAYGRSNWDMPNPNGIACPQCEGELQDSNPSIVLSSYPVKMNVHCPTCAYHGYRVCGRPNS
jgi:deoxyribodipyrimidine photolyase-like uncharacterized protein